MTDIVTKKTTRTTGREKADASQTIGYVIYFIFGAMEILLLIRLVFKLTGANPDSGFVGIIYSVTQLLIAPFGGIFRQATTPGVETTAVLEPSDLIAIVVYAVLAWGLTQIITILSGKLK